MMNEITIADDSECRVSVEHVVLYGVHRKRLRIVVEKGCEVVVSVPEPVYRQIVDAIAAQQRQGRPEVHVCLCPQLR